MAATTTDPMPHRTPSSASLLLLVVGVPLVALSACTAGQDLGKQTTGGADAGPSVTDQGSSSGDGGSHGPTCSGTPLPCAGYGFDTECTQNGCQWTPQTCTGNANSCNSLSQALCPMNPGCVWQQLFGEFQCVGMAVACDERTSTGNGVCDEVAGKSGCTLNGGCSGTPQKCSAYPGLDCSTHEGCKTTF